jgi:hypothetical protein
VQVILTYFTSSRNKLFTMDNSRKSTVNFPASHGIGIYIRHRILSYSAVARSIVLCRPTQLSRRHLVPVSVWNCTTSYPNLLLTHTGSRLIQLPKVWSANTYRHSLISKVVGVPVCEKAAYFSSLTFTLHIYYSNIFKIFQIIFCSVY